MTWFKIDDSFYDHPKVFDAPDCAVALWTRAGTWSARNLTDGFVPTGMPARLCDDPDTAVRELLRRGLWTRTGGGYRFHDWADYQPSAESVKDLRAKRAAAGKQGGQAKAAKQRASKPLANASQVGKQNAAPTRPDPPPTGERVVAVAPPRPGHVPACPYQTRDPLTCSVCASERKAPLADLIDQELPLPWPDQAETATPTPAPTPTDPPAAAPSAPANAKAAPTPRHPRPPRSTTTGRPQQHDQPPPSAPDLPSSPAANASPPPPPETDTPAAGSRNVIPFRRPA